MTSNDKILYFGIKVNIVGDFCLKEPIISYTNGFQVSIFIEKGVYKISTIKLVGENDALKIKYTINTEKTNYVVPDESAYKDYIQLLQHIEALGGFNYGIKKILYQDTIEICWYLGNPFFQDLEPILSLFKQKKEHQKKILSQSNLSSILLLNKIIPEAVIPYNFYREANRYMDIQAYREAYLHFYMLLEFCFAEGKTGIGSQVDSFVQNEDYVLGLLQTIKLFKDNNISDFEVIYNETIALDKTKLFTIKSITRLLYDYRGRLAHGTSRSKPYIFNDAALKPITVFIGSLCLSVCGNMQVYASAFTNKKETYVKNNIDELKKSLSIS